MSSFRSLPDRGSLLLSHCLVRSHGARHSVWQFLHLDRLASRPSHGRVVPLRAKTEGSRQELRSQLAAPIVTVWRLTELTRCQVSNPSTLSRSTVATAR